MQCRAPKAHLEVHIWRGVAPNIDVCTYGLHILCRGALLEDSSKVGRRGRVDMLIDLVFDLGVGKSPTCLLQGLLQEPHDIHKIPCGMRQYDAIVAEPKERHIYVLQVETQPPTLAFLPCVLQRPREAHSVQSRT